MGGYRRYRYKKSDEEDYHVSPFLIEAGVGLIGSSLDYNAVYNWGVKSVKAAGPYYMKMKCATMIGLIGVLKLRWKVNLLKLPLSTEEKQ